jgi:HK97 gp10 family phage protein
MSDGVEGLSKLIAELDKLKNLDVAKIASVGGYTILAEAQKNAPLKTGYLRSTGYIEPIEGQGCEIGFSADYAFYPEYGTAKMKAQPYLRPAIDTQADKAVEQMGKEATKEMEAKIK